MIIVAKKEFKSESKRLLDLMINSIYTNKDIFLRELISNASDALDKLYYRSLTDKKVKVDKDDLSIDLAFDRDSRTLTITDNGCGMNYEGLKNAIKLVAEFAEKLPERWNTNIGENGCALSGGERQRISIARAF